MFLCVAVVCIPQNILIRRRLRKIFAPRKQHKHTVAGNTSRQRKKFCATTAQNFSAGYFIGQWHFGNLQRWKCGLLLLGLAVFVSACSPPTNFPTCPACSDFSRLSLPLTAPTFPTLRPADRSDSSDSSPRLFRLLLLTSPIDAPDFSDWLPRFFATH